MFPNINRNHIFLIDYVHQVNFSLCFQNKSFFSHFFYSLYVFRFNFLCTVLLLFFSLPFLKAKNFMQNMKALL